MRMIIKRYLWLGLTLLAVIAPMNTFAENDVEIHGFMSQGYMVSSDNNFFTETEKGSFQYNDFGLNFQYIADDRLSIGAQLGGRDLGTVGNDEVKVNWAYGDYRWRDWLGFRAGITKSPFALYFESRDVDVLRTWALLPQSVYNEMERDGGEGVKGITLYGNVDMTSAGILSYYVKVADLQADLNSGTAQGVKAAFGFSSIDAHDFSTFYGAGVNWSTPLDGLLIGLSGVIIDESTLSGTLPLGHPMNPAPAPLPIDIDINDIERFFYSIEYTHQNLIMAAEYMTSSNTTVIGPSETTKERFGFYVSAAYRFFDWFEAGAYYSKGVADNEGSGQDNELKDRCLSTRFDVTSNMTVKLEVHSMDGLNGVNASNDGTLENNWQLYVTKVSYNF